MPTIWRFWRLSLNPRVVVPRCGVNETPSSRSHSSHEIVYYVLADSHLGQFQILVIQTRIQFTILNVSVCNELAKTDCCWTLLFLWARLNPIIVKKFLKNIFTVCSVLQLFLCIVLQTHKDSGSCLFCSWFGAGCVDDSKKILQLYICLKYYAQQGVFLW